MPTTSPVPSCLATVCNRPWLLLGQVRTLWAGWLADVDALFPQLQDHGLRASWKTQIRAPLQAIFSGAAFGPVLARCNAIHQRVLKGRV